MFNYNSVKIPHDKNIITPKIERALDAGWYEGKEGREVPRIIEKKERILEIGAGIGYISTLAYKTKLAEAIMVVEANPSLIPFIKEVHNLNQVQNVDVLHGVLSHKPDNEIFQFYLRNDFWASSLSAHPKNFNEIIQVKSRNFTKILNQFKPTMIICDIEGGEIDLFNNVLLKGVEKVLIEVHQNVIGRKNMIKLFDFFSNQNFHYDQHHSSGSVILFSHYERGAMRKELLSKNNK